jgi:glucokinase
LNGPQILRRASEKTAAQGGPDAILSQIDRLVAEVAAGTAPGSIAGIAIASAGPLDSDEGVILGIPTLPGWDGFPIRSVLAERTGLPVLLENDAIAAAFGEWRHGAGAGLGHVAYLTVSTGIGGGFVIDGKVVRGRKGMAGHVGHIRIADDGPRCSCGATGCFEAFASGSAFEARAAQHFGQITAKEVFEAARVGDPLGTALVAQEAEYLGQGITSIIHLVSPELVVMGGGLSQAFDLLNTGIHDVIERDAMAPFKDVKVVPAVLGDNSGLIGAAALMHEKRGI